jgi:hypothetical protein
MATYIQYFEPIPENFQNLYDNEITDKYIYFLLDNRFPAVYTKTEKYLLEGIQSYMRQNYWEINSINVRSQLRKILSEWLDYNNINYKKFGSYNQLFYKIVDLAINHVNSYTQIFDDENNGTYILK